MIAENLKDRVSVNSSRALLDQASALAAALAFRYESLELHSDTARGVRSRLKTLLELVLHPPAGLPSQPERVRALPPLVKLERSQTLRRAFESATASEPRQGGRASKASRETWKALLQQLEGDAELADADRKRLIKLFSEIARAAADRFTHSSFRDIQ
ncbi:MAG: hypothetical protein KJ058_01955 [Thermoanaerobaculia bacterium]|nr:hypothetical protein [Thermoanaerobaculia bacterium]